VGKHGKITKTCDRCRKKTLETLTRVSEHRRITGYMTKYHAKRLAEDEEGYRAKRVRAVAAYREVHKDRMNAEQKLRLTDRLRSAKHGAAKRGHAWELSPEQETALMQRGTPCFYCGTVPEDTLNGIDRMDSMGVYTTENCVTCCGACNFMKGCLDAKTFVERCGQVSMHHGGPGATTTAWRDIKSTTFTSYITSARSRGLAFELLQDEFDALVAKACTYCGREPTSKHKTGVDRLDSSAGYFSDNCVPCCGECNVAKRTMTASAFVDKCKAVAGRGVDIPEMPRCLSVICVKGPP
jgi:hypothetical protein